MKVHLKYFASVREALGFSEETWDTQATTLGELRDALIARSGAHAVALERSRTLRMALNQVLVMESASISEGCEVAFFPPVTGG